MTIVACGGSGGGAAVDGGGGGGDGGAATCADVCAADACGSNAACDCAACHYGVAPVGSDAGPLVYANGDIDHLGLGGGVATRAGSAWTFETEDVAPGAPASLAIASDGTRWLATAGGQEVWVAHGSGSAWVSDELSTTGEGGSLAIAGDGSVVIAWTETGVVKMARTARSALGAGSAAWTTTTVATRANPVNLTLALEPGGDAVALAWSEPSQGTGPLVFATATLDGSAGAVETIDGSGAFDLPVALQIDDAGSPHVAYEQTAVGVRRVFHGVRGASGAWTTEAISGPVDNGFARVRLAVGSGGAMAALYGDGAALVLAQHDNGAWLAQPIVADCTLGGDVAFTGDALHVVQGCTTVAGAAELVRGSDYPADHDAKCADAAAVLCADACACGANCLLAGSGNVVVEGQGSATCVAAVALALCGDATQDASAIDACDADTAAAGSALACNAVHAAEAPASCVLE